MPDHVMTQAVAVTTASRPLTADEVRRASLTVASAATSADDCRDLLDCLGLLPAAAERRAS